MASRCKPPREESQVVLNVSEDDLEDILAGKTVTIPHPGDPDGVLWAPDPHHPLTAHDVEQLRTVGLHHRVREPGADEPFMPLLRIGAPGWPRDEDGVRVVLSHHAYRLLCGLVQGSSRIDLDQMTGEAWPELRRSFPATDYIPAPAGRVRYENIAASSPSNALAIARAMAAEMVDVDFVCLAPVPESDGHYGVTVIYQEKETPTSPAS
jgi:hypothetical protein